MKQQETSNENRLATLKDTQQQEDSQQEKTKETTKASQQEKSDKPIIAITGSAGKTTTKAFLASILSKKWNVFQSKDDWLQQGKSIGKSDSYRTGCYPCFGFAYTDNAIESCDNS